MATGHQVFVVEDDAVTRQSLVRKIDAYAGLEVCGEAEGLAAARERLAELTPDVLVVDLELGDGDGTDLIAEQSRDHPDLAIMVISVFGDEQRVVRALAAGAQGYLLKDGDSNRIGNAITDLLAGGSPISPAIARYLIRYFRPPTPAAPLPADAELSARELEVLRLAAKGFTYAESASILGVSINTVGTFTKRIYGKLAVSSRSQAVYEATRLGILDDP